MDRLIFGLALFVAFCIGLSVGEERQHRRDAALWGQFISDAVMRSVKVDRN